MELLEALWDDLSGQPEQLLSPDWHESILEQRKQQVQSGNETITDWESAKQEIRRKTV